MVSRWCRVVSLSQWCPGDVPVMFRWCSCGVSAVSRCRSAGPVVSGVRVLSQWYPGRFPVVSRWCLGSVPVVGVPVAVVSRAVVCLGGVPVLFPNSHQVWGLLLTRFMFVLASIFGECTIRCPSLFSSWCPGGVPVVSRWCPGGVPVVSRWCPVVFRRCNGLVSVRWCPNGVPVVPVVSRWCCSVSSGVPVVSRWLVPQSCPGGVAVASRGVPVVSSGVQWCPGDWCPVVSPRCPSVVPVVSWSCPLLPGS